LVKEIELYNGLCVKPRGTMPVDAKGWRHGDCLQFTPCKDGIKGFETKLVLETDSTAYIRLPRKLKEAEYEVTLKRAAGRQVLGKTMLKVPQVMPEGTPVSAHRAVWDAPGSAQNSRTAVRKAMEMGIYACEIDVWRTTDGKLVVNHDGVLNGVRIQNTSYDEIKDLKLPNGEKIPLLSEIFDMIKTPGATINLMIEIKRHKTAEKNEAVVEAVVDLIKQYGLQDRVCFISFGYAICEHLAKLLPQCVVYYIEHMTRDTSKEGHPFYEGDGIVELSKLCLAGIKGISVGYGIVPVRHPEWVEISRREGLKLNCCVFDGAERIIEANNMGADVLVTNTPQIAQRIYLHYRNNRKK